MACTVCSQDFNDRARRPTCASCAAALLYAPRLQQIQLLVDRDNAHSHAEAVLRPGNDGVIAALPQDANWDAISSGIKKESITRVRDDLATAQERVSRLQLRLDALKGEVLRYRDHLAAQTNSRKTDLQRCKDRLVGDRTSADDRKSSLRKTGQKLQRSHHRMVDARAQLCARAAVLAGLRQRRDRIVLGGIVVPNIKELGASPKDSDESQMQSINASLSNVARLLSIWTHYLSSSPPAELLMPHSDSPHFMILTEKSSYRNDVKARPRPLRLDRPISKLVKEDTKAFGLYIEGVMLLAWNVAWLCKTQGAATTMNTFDEVCDIGRNLWTLYCAADSRNAAFGALSHGTVQSLAGLQPHQLTDQLRSHLLVELTGREWDVLSEQDYDDDEMPILVGGTGRKRDTAMSIMSIGDTEERKEKGWMKVRGRPLE